MHRSILRAWKEVLRRRLGEYPGGTPTEVTAEVQGTEKYNVKVDLKNGISAERNCPYDLEGYCKHIIAVLLSMLDNEEEIRGHDGKKPPIAPSKKVEDP